MSNILLTASSGQILGPIAKFLGWIMNAIYMFVYNVFGIESVVLSIVIVTFLIYLCMLPLTIKQQKFSKLTQLMQPEIQAIAEKYKGKRDQASIQAMNNEQQLVYEKYGVNPMGTCLPMLIQMPIWLALYRVFYNIPAYITSVKGYFTGLVNEIQNASGYKDSLAQLLKDYNYTTSSGLSANNVKAALDGASGSDLSNYIVDILYKLPSTGWEKLSEVFPNATSQIETTFGHMQNFNFFLGLNISDTPLAIIKSNFASHAYGFVLLALLVPVLSYLSQLINLKLMPQSNNGQNDQMAQQMKTMNFMMPLMMFIFSFTVPVGLVVYWICSALVRGGQQLIVNKYFEKVDLDDIIRKNQEKAKKRREKLGISENQIRDAANIKTKSIESRANKMTSAERELELERAAAKKANAKSGSMAAKANRVKEFNERNSK